jgi:NTE family protein
MSKPQKKTAAKTTAGKTAGPRSINLALQGGGAQGAFTWGVLDKLLTYDALHIESITATSAGAMNAVVVAQGLIEGDGDHARKLLTEFWRKVSTAASMLPFKPTMVEKMMGAGGDIGFSPSFIALDYMMRLFSPYQLNLFDINPLRSIVEETVDFEAIRKNKKIRLFVNATNVRTGKNKVFKTEEMTLDMVMASACLPFIFKTVYIDGEPYWDGSYSGNPPIYPLIYHAESQDVVFVQINPLHVEEIPTNASDIMNRINEISGNTFLMGEMRAIAFVKRLIDEGKLPAKDYKNMRIHMIEAEEIMSSLKPSSKLNADWTFLSHLHNIGTQAAEDWVEKNYDKLGKEGTIDVRKEFL